MYEPTDGQACKGKLAIFGQTYLRGANLTTSADIPDLEARNFDDKVILCTKCTLHKTILNIRQLRAWSLIRNEKPLILFEETAMQLRSQRPLHEQDHPG
jgi:hypothetical protein